MPALDLGYSVVGSADSHLSPATCLKDQHSSIKAMEEDFLVSSSSRPPSSVLASTEDDGGSTIRDQQSLLVPDLAKAANAAMTETYDHAPLKPLTIPEGAAEILAELMLPAVLDFSSSPSSQTLATRHKKGAHRPQAASHSLLGKVDFSPKHLGLGRPDLDLINGTIPGYSDSGLGSVQPAVMSPITPFSCSAGSPDPQRFTPLVGATGKRKLFQEKETKVRAKKASSPSGIFFHSTPNFVDCLERMRTTLMTGM